MPSSLLRLLVLLAAVQSLALLWLSLPDWRAAAAGSLLVLLLAVWELRRVASFRGCLSTAGRRWFWRDGSGRKREFRFSGELVLWRWLVVINGRDLQGRRFRLVAARDSAHPDDWRRLQAALRFSRSA